MVNKIVSTDIVNALKAVAANHTLTTADQIFDENYYSTGDGEYQDVLNKNFAQGIKDEATARNSAIATLESDIDEEYAKKDGKYENLTAGYAEELVGDSADRRQDTAKYLIRPTAGYLEVRANEPMSLIGVRGLLNNECEPWLGTALRFNGFNAVIPSQALSGVTISGNKIVSGGNKIVYFRCVKGEWGEYGIKNKNNGYVFTDADSNEFVPVNVGYSEELPGNGVSIFPIPTHVENGHTYYLPEVNGSYFCVEVSSSIVPVNICAHLAWDNKDDDTFKVRTEQTVDFTNVRNMIHSWGLAGIESETYNVYDEFSAELVESGESAAKWVRRVDRKTLASASFQWVMSTADTSGSRIYTYKAELGDAKSDGLIKSVYDGALVLEGNSLVFTSSTISSITALRNAFGSNYVYYELDAPDSGTATLMATVNGEGGGTEEVIGTDGDNAYLTTAYFISLKAYLSHLPIELEENNKAISERITNTENEIASLYEYFNGKNCGDLLADSINLTGLGLKINNNDYWVSKAGTPINTATVSGFKFREYYDETNKHFYKGNGSDSWLEMIDRGSLNTTLSDYKTSANTTLEINAAVKAGIEELDVTDTKVDGKYVSQVTETNGKIVVSRDILCVDCGTF